ncbi:MAG: hypothetical protein ACI3U1_06230, partial [Peptococcaceae bacterium]
FYLLFFFSYLFSLTYLMYHDDHSVRGEQNMQMALFSAQPSALQPIFYDGLTTDSGQTFCPHITDNLSQR